MKDPVGKDEFNITALPPTSQNKEIDINSTVI